MSIFQWMILILGGATLILSVGFALWGIGMLFEREVFGLFSLVAGAALTAVCALLMYSVIFEKPAPLKPEGCYKLTHERKFTGKTYITVEALTSFPCPEGV